MSKFLAPKLFPKQPNSLKENIDSSRIIHFVEMKISKLINYATNMCGS
jgi:hypothetical protein